MAATGQIGTQADAPSAAPGGFDPMSIVSGLNKTVSQVAKSAAQNAEELKKQAEEAEEKRKQESRDKLKNITNEIDMNLEKKNLLSQMAQQDGILAQALEEDLERQKAK